MGVLVQANHGKREDLRIAGIPVGREMTGAWPQVGDTIAAGPEKGKPAPMDKNSLLIVIATDAPLMPHQLERLARRGGKIFGAATAFPRAASGRFAGAAVAFARAGRFAGVAGAVGAAAEAAVRRRGVGFGMGLLRGTRLCLERLSGRNSR